MTTWCNDKKNRAALTMRLQTHEMCKQIEIVGILQYLLQLKPTVSVPQFTDTLVCV